MMTRMWAMCVVALAGLAQLATANVLDAARGSDRLLVVCGADPSALAAAQQALVDADGYAERALSMLVSSPRMVTWQASGVCRVEPDAGVQRLDGCAGETPQVLLIGKDGGIKGRWRAAVPASVLFPLIDAMPMRMREMRAAEATQ